MSWSKLHADVEALAQQIPEGQVRLMLVDGKRYCLSHISEGFRLSAAHCPHLGESLTKGSLNPFGELICPLHHYRFELLTGQESAGRCTPLRIYPTKVEQGALMARL